MAQNQSWLELLDSSNSCSNDLLSPKRLSLDFPIDTDENEDTRERSFEIKILDKSNEKKFDNLVNQQKSPFKLKRRLSNEKLPEVPVFQANTPSRQKKKRSKFDIDDDNKQNETLEDGEVLDISSSIIAKKRFRSESSEASSSNGSSTEVLQNRELETDKGTLERRQKQIDYGKNTVGYDHYLQEVPKTQRTRDHPKTPPKHLKFSRRAWEGLIKAWRKKLHKFDPQDGPDNNDDNATF